jgi:SAM-dependent methyltransferase
VPLPARKRLALWVERQRWIASRSWWSQELLRDMAEEQPNAYHRFLWANHLAYADSYEVAQRFGEERIHPSRHLLFEQLLDLLRGSGVEPARDVASVLEVGGSMGYNLRHLERSCFPAARVLDGIDIDEYAIQEGARHLAAEGSKVRLLCGDMKDLPALLEGRRYDVTLCAGVLMYLQEADAADVVAEMLRHTRGVVAIAGLAHPRLDNRLLAASERRERDLTFIHNIDRMVERAGGTIVDRRWEGPRVLHGNTIYFVFCRAAAGV